MKRRWKKFLAGVLSAALALNLAAPLALAGSPTIGAACRVTSVFLYPKYVGRVDDNERVPYIQGEVSYDHGLLTFHGDVTLDTTLDSENYSLVKALSEENLRLVANGKVTGRTKSNGFDGAKEIVRGEYDLSNTDAGNQSKGILGATNDKTTIASDTRITLKGFQTGIGWGSVQIDGKVKITNAEYGIANFTTMNHGSELVIHAQQYIGEQGHLTYNGGHLLLNVTTIGMDFGLSRLGIGKDVSRFWYRTGDDENYTEIDTNVQEKLDSFFEVKETNHAYAVKKVAELLKPNGILLMTDLVVRTYLQELTAAFLENGFADIRDKRKEAGLVTPDCLLWRECLSEAGLGEDCAVTERYGRCICCSRQQASVLSYHNGALREYLSEKLPEYMVPQNYHFMEQLPTLSNGKINRKQLREDFKEETAVIRWETACKPEVLCSGSEYGRLP